MLFSTSHDDADTLATSHSGPTIVYPAMQFSKRNHVGLATALIATEYKDFIEAGQYNSHCACCRGLQSGRPYGETLQVVREKLRIIAQARERERERVK